MLFVVRKSDSFGVTILTSSPNGFRDRRNDILPHFQDSSILARNYRKVAGSLGGRD